MGHEKDVPCVFCGGDVAGTVWVLCATCEVPCHKSCWDGRGSCPVYGCTSTQAVDPATAMFRKKPGAGQAAVVAAGAAGDGAASQAVAVRREIDALEIADVVRQDRQAKLFGTALGGWALSLVLAGSFPAFYMLGAGWFLTFLTAAGLLEVRGWLSDRRRRELERTVRSAGARVR